MKKSNTKRSYAIFSDDGSNELLRISSSDYSKRTVNREGNSSHPEMDITYFKGMAGVFTIGDTDYDVVPGDIFVVRSNEKHKITGVTQAGVVENTQLNPFLLWHDADYHGLKFLSVFNPDASDFVNKIDRQSNTYKTVINLLGDVQAEVANKGYGCEQMIKMRMYMLLFTIARDIGFSNDSEDVATASRLEAIRKSVQYIDEHLSEQITVPELAELANLSQNYYRALFKQSVGVSPIKYITSKRIAKAVSMLNGYQGNMLDLALECGFNSTASFNRAFRMYTGQVPSHYLPKVL